MTNFYITILDYFYITIIWTMISLDNKVHDIHLLQLSYHLLLKLKITMNKVSNNNNKNQIDCSLMSMDLYCLVDSF